MKEVDKVKQFQQYSRYYDSLYQDKDYKQETLFVKEAIKRYSPHSVRSILSLGCGTCSHDLILASEGCLITGVDRSQTMLDIAREKAQEKGLDEKIELHNQDARQLNLPGRYDFAMAMFNVIGYQVNNSDLEMMLRGVNRSLQDDSLFVFDCWYAPAVLKDHPTDRVKEFENGVERIVRVTKSRLKIENNIIEINFHVLKILGSMISDEIEEQHLMRYWSVPELEYFLKKGGFKLLKVCNFGNLKSEPSDQDWNIFVVSQKEK